MEINLTKCNFSKLISYITSIDGELKDAPINHVADVMYDDTWDNNENELADSMEGSILDVLDIIKEAMKDETSKNTSIHVEDGKYWEDKINLWMYIENNTGYVLSLRKSIYKEKINAWLAINAESITMNV